MDPRRVQVGRLVPVARLDSAWAGVSYGMYQILHDTNNVTDSGCHCVSADHSSMVTGSVASSSELLLGPVFETKAATSKSGNGVGRG